MVKKTQIILILALIFAYSARISAYSYHAPVKNKVDKKDSIRWVDSVFNSLTPNERITQMFMVAAYPNKDQKHIDQLSQWIKEYKVGGIIFFQGGPVKMATLNNYCQKISKVPLLISIDGEWGLSMRLDSTINYPHQMMLGAIDDDELIYQMGADIARQCRRIGIQVNFAPDVDVNSNPQNPVINSRSFGEDKYMVARKALAYMKGMQDNGVLAVAKHFPGHGNTDQDSHFTLPVIYNTKALLDSLDLYPFKRLIANGIGGIMSAHLYVPALDSSANVPSSVSKPIISGLLRNKLGYKGLVFTDALSMKAVTDYFPSGILEPLCIKAGNDILLMPSDVPTALREIRCEIELGNIRQSTIDSACKKILAVKYFTGLNHYKPVNLNHLVQDLNSVASQLLRRKLTEASLTLISNKGNLIPFKNLDTLNMAAMVIGSDTLNNFQRTLNLYSEMKQFNINRDSLKCNKLNLYIDSLSKYNMVVVGICNTDFRNTKNYGINPTTIFFIDSLCQRTNVVLDLFGSPYNLWRFKNLKKIKAILVSYEDYEFTRDLSAQLLFGGIKATGKLPVTACSDFICKTGIMTSEKIRMKYSWPEELGINRHKLDKIDSICNDAINRNVIPGCQVLVAKKGVVFYYKAFGHPTYDSKNNVKTTDLYDIASVTKVTSTLPVIMKLCEDGKIDIQAKLSDYLPELKKTNKKNMIIRDVLLHQARLKEWIPFYQNTIKPTLKGESLFSKTGSETYPIKFTSNSYANKNISYLPGIYSKTRSDSFPDQVADSMYIVRTYRDSILHLIDRSELLKKKEYKYSDLGFIYMYELAEKLTKQKINDYVYQNFYKSLGASTLGYLPLTRFDRKRIAPTENDRVWRKQLVQGYVHDPVAAMLGGVSGHAGLFSNANDLAKMMQMYLQKGEYGGKRYFSPETIDLFTSCPACNEGNRRGLGFEKPEPNPAKESPVCRCVSLKSFGHTGFTGTMVWDDPETQVVYIFLSNRVFPDAVTNKLAELGVRGKIQRVISNAISGY
jgi:beta-N-acetylhexosaminidase